MERAIRFAGSEWHEGGKLNKDKFATAIVNIAAKVLSAKPASSKWNDTTGELTFPVTRPSQLAPALELTETLEMTALISPDKPGASDRMIVWLGVPSTKTTDETQGPHLAENSGGRGRKTNEDDNGLIKALATELKGQRWDTDKASWK